ncbi:MAG TPA: hypothetical protein VE549_02210 [Myxococcaceae bacterium]|jgi:hypothetical protein|nr:hypothetical protein [Myxococcaceae bacterium]
MPHLQMRRLWIAVAAMALIACPPGPQGPKGDSATIAPGSGLVGDGSTANPVRVDFAGSGTANTVARSDHDHGPVTPDRLAGPAKMYSRLMTPRWLEANASIHSARTVTVTDSAIAFGAAGAGNDNTRLFTVPLIPGGVLKTNETYVVRIVVTQAVPSGDNDPIFGVSDGTALVGFVKADAANSEGNAAVTGAEGNNLAASSSVSFGVPGSSIGAFEVLFRLEPAVGGSSPVYLMGRFGTEATHYRATTTLDRTAGLFFSTYAGHAAEVYTFHSFDVSVDREG